MLRKMILIVVALFMLLICNSELVSGELILKWNVIEYTDRVYDIEFMPNHDYFITGSANQIKIRRTDNGDSIKSFPLRAFDIEFTPDSSRIVLLTAINNASGDPYGRLQLRNLEDMSLIKEFVLEDGPDTNGPNGWYSTFKLVVIDPIKPYLYAIWKRGEALYDPGKPTKLYYTIQKYDYEKMELVEDLTYENELGTEFTHLAISKDGKYLAALNIGYSKLIVWDLESNERIVEHLFCAFYEPELWGIPSSMKFSETETNQLYISGAFPRGYENNIVKYKYYGVIEFDVVKNQIIDSTFAVTPLDVGAGICELFDNEERIINSGVRLTVSNLKNKKREYLSDGKTIIYTKSKILFDSKNKIFLAFGSGGGLTSFYYDKSISVDNENSIISTIYPNPSNGIVQIKSDCQDENCKCEIYGINGVQLINIPIIVNNSGQISIDLSTVKSGVYYIVLSKFNKTETYKIVKE